MPVVALALALAPRLLAHHSPSFFQSPDNTQLRVLLVCHCSALDYSFFSHIASSTHRLVSHREELTLRLFPVKCFTEKHF